MTDQIRAEPTTPTIGQTISEIRWALRDYIEATYHIGNESLIRRRRALLDETGVMFQTPYIETTPRYRSGAPFASLGLPKAAAVLLQAMAHPVGKEPKLINDPPYAHQAAALQRALKDQRSVVITTGTGSGKTESFLLPVIGRLATEAQERPRSFATPAVRAILLYPMNALVNDQLGRLRLMLGDPGVSKQFVAWAGRPARFARYTSRTLYPGVRSAKKDQDRLRPIGRFYIDVLDKAESGDPSEQEANQLLLENLRLRGKWPSKPDMRAWYGASGSRWQNARGQFVRAVALAGDAELLTRHEVLEQPPDLLVTNYSMLEYMLMRPLERPVFDATREWLGQNPKERLILVIDEAHLYRGAGGAEVGLLLRRLRTRLGIEAQRLQVICTSASFTKPEAARVFAAQLSGKELSDFDAIVGDLDLRPDERPGTAQDAELLSSVRLDDFYGAETDDARLAAVAPVLVARSVPVSGSAEAGLYEALKSYPPMSLLVNLTMREARPLHELGARIFPGVEAARADPAVTGLIALGSAARLNPGEPGLLPCRIHTFLRGLPGLWACIDPQCAATAEDARGPVGKLFAQPQEACACGARVFELYTCRNCGAAYARAYTDDLIQPTYLWAEPGSAFTSVTGEVTDLEPIDLCLEEPIAEGVEPADLDLVTGRLNPGSLGPRTRQVFLKAGRHAVKAARHATADTDDDDGDPKPELAGEFRPCGVCGQQAAYGRTSVQDHQTKGDEPFQALISRQIEVQPPGRQAASDFAPLRGRKVLTFSDSRQAAARLAPNLQTYSMRDVLRPLILSGMRDLQRVQMLAPSLSLSDLYLAVLIGARTLGVRLRPALKSGESLHVQRDVDAVVKSGKLENPEVMLGLFMAVRTEAPPRSLLQGMVATITHRHYGFQSLALASLCERRNLTDALLQSLPPLPPVATTREQKLALVRFWLNEWTAPGIWFPTMPIEWWQTKGGVKSHSGVFKAIKRWLGTPAVRREFERKWLPELVRTFCETPAPKKHRIKADTLTLSTDGAWGYCQACRTTQRPFPGTSRCINCSRDKVEIVDPNSDPVFVARKGYYRGSALRALETPPKPPMAIIAAEHTAQLNAAQADEVFSIAEEHELLFQDVDLGPSASGAARSAIDVLSCTTTMEVGIDIGTLSGAALRNMPPSRSNYQQRAGRAGRRGNSVATVVAFGSADSHDEHYFREPDAMIRGPVIDPLLTLDNVEIARRHVAAFLLQRYHQVRLPVLRPDEQPQLYEVLGKVQDFKKPESTLNRKDFEQWLRQGQDGLTQEVDGWLPRELSGNERTALLRDMIDRTLAAIDEAIADPGPVTDPQDDGKSPPEVVEEPDTTEAPPETGEEVQDPTRAGKNLLDRLLYKGVLPRYAFPTDVVSFYVFDRERSTRFRPAFQYAPAQGLPAALSQYAPGKEVWIDGKLWTSGALYSPMRSDLYEAWQDRQLYFECSVCHYARTETHQQAERGELRDCPACASIATFGKAKNWLRPPGFAHPQSIEEGTSPDDQPGTSYATRAKLIAPGPADQGKWQLLAPRLKQYYERAYLLVSNTGPRQEGYTYCTRCGLIEPTASSTGKVNAAHTKPYPDAREPLCSGGKSTNGLVLGTDFLSDVLLISLTVESPLILRPGLLATQVALRTLCEALTLAATTRLEIEGGELQAEYRPALTDKGHQGLEAEIYIYDTLAGGAGFARRIAELGLQVFRDALEQLSNCPAKCDRSCYRCLRSFKNRFEHDLLDRHLGASLLRYFLMGDEPVLDEARLEQAADRAFSDLSRQRPSGVEFSRNVDVQLPGLGTVNAPILATSGTRRLIVGVHGPLTPDHSGDPNLRDAKEYGGDVPVLLLDEIVIARNLPFATRQVLAAIQ